MNNLQAERTIPKCVNPRTAISVHKTEVTNVATLSEVASKDDITNKCPIHNKPQPLRKCRCFRLKTLEERRTYLREQGICFRGCSSSSHLARDCKVMLKCDECESESHITALHPGPPKLASKKSSHSQDDGEEQGKEDTSASPVIGHLCTEVHGNNIKSKSCSKICLVKVYPKEHPEKAVKMYAMLDDQSNKSLVRSQFFEVFKIKVNTCPHMLLTCAGLSTTSGSRATGFQIEAANGGMTLSLPELIECDDLRDNR